ASGSCAYGASWQPWSIAPARPARLISTPSARNLPPGLRFAAVETAVVTGAGRGIGREIARLVVARGYTVLVGDVNLAAAEETAALLGERAWAMELDVREPRAHR